MLVDELRLEIEILNLEKRSESKKNIKLIMQVKSSFFFLFVWFDSKKT